MSNNQINPDELLFADAFLNEHFDRIVEWAVGDIKRCCKMNPDGTCDDNGALVGAFILWCCVIEYFGGLYIGNPNNGGAKDRFKGFITKYMSIYDYQKVYDLRWSLLHYYSPHHFVLYHENNLTTNKHKHLSKSNRGIMLHLGWSVKDLEDGVTKYHEELKTSDDLKMKAWKYYKKQYPIMPLKVEEVYRGNTNNSLVSATTIGNIDASGTVSQDYWLKK